MPVARPILERVRTTPWAFVFPNLEARLPLKNPSVPGFLAPDGLLWRSASIPDLGVVSTDFSIYGGSMPLALLIGPHKAAH